MIRKIVLNVDSLLKLLCLCKVVKITSLRDSCRRLIFGHINLFPSLSTIFDNHDEKRGDGDCVPEIQIELLPIFLNLP